MNPLYGQLFAAIVVIVLLGMIGIFQGFEERFDRERRSLQARMKMHALGLDGEEILGERTGAVEEGAPRHELEHK